MTNAPVERFFDLNIEKVLEHWSVPFAIREVVSNALDEQVLTGTADPEIVKLDENSWAITDFGRGLRYEHLTQNENAEKRRHPGVIGQFGMGLKDALAVFDRRGVAVEILSPHCDVTTVARPKEGFLDIKTLHACVRTASEPGRVGTTFVLRGVRDEDVETAKRYFLRYNIHRELESTRYGQVLERPAGEAGSIYVKGLLVAREDKFLFSYNITSLTKDLREALNRERSNVGRQAYSDRVKAILTHCKTPEVARALADDLSGFASGDMHDELRWADVAVRACRILPTYEPVVYVTAHQLRHGGAQLDYAVGDGYRLVLVPDDISYRLQSERDLDGKPIMDFYGYRDHFNASFEFDFVEPASLGAGEAYVYGLTDQIVKASGLDLSQVDGGIRISNTMRLNNSGNEILGVFEPDSRRIVVRRDRLGSLVQYSGTLIHELVHACTGTADGTLAFEEALTDQLGVVLAKVLSSA